MVIADRSVVGENLRMDSTVPDWPPPWGVLRWNAELRVYAPAPTRNAVASTVGNGKCAARRDLSACGSCGGSFASGRCRLRVSTGEPHEKASTFDGLRDWGLQHRHSRERRGTAMLFSQRRRHEYMRGDRLRIVRRRNCQSNVYVCCATRKHHATSWLVVEPGGIRQRLLPGLQTRSPCCYDLLVYIIGASAMVSRIGSRNSEYIHLNTGQIRRGPVHRLQLRRFAHANRQRWDDNYCFFFGNVGDRFLARRSRHADSATGILANEMPRTDQPARLPNGSGAYGQDAFSASAARAMQRKPRWQVDVSIGCGMRAAGR